MTILPIKKLFNTHFFYTIIIILFSFSINFYYSKLGVFPIDTFLHYDSAYRILENEIPFRDYWIVSGLVVDVIQSIFFKLFGTNWFAYILHSSIFNCLVALFTYFFLIELKLNKFKATFYTFSFAILAYTISGTPFVDHHAAFFLLIATFLIIKNLKLQRNYLWVLIVFLFFLSFLSKQVPVTYASLLYSVILFYYLIKKKEINRIFVILSSIFIIIIVFLIILKIVGIDLKIFFIQYIDFPRSIGSSRLEYLDITVNSLFNHYKFLIFPIIIIIWMKFRKINLKKKISFSEENVSLMILLALAFSLIFHQIMSKNQIFIYFLIPIFFGYLDSTFNESKENSKKFISIFLIIFLTFITLKYHFRYNEPRKFHELATVNLGDAIKANLMHESLNSLSWINPLFKGNANDEISILRIAKKRFDNLKKNEVMLITHYQFLQSITKKKLNYPNRTYTTDGVSMPSRNNKHYKSYKNYLINKIKKEKISEIYFFKHESISNKVVTDYIDKKCYSIKEDEIFLIFELKCFQ